MLEGGTSRTLPCPGASLRSVASRQGPAGIGRGELQRAQDINEVLLLLPGEIVEGCNHLVCLRSNLACVYVARIAPDFRTPFRPEIVALDFSAAALRCEKSDFRNLKPIPGARFQIGNENSSARNNTGRRKLSQCYGTRGRGNAACIASCHEFAAIPQQKCVPPSSQQSKKTRIAL